MRSRKRGGRRADAGTERRPSGKGRGRKIKAPRGPITHTVAAGQTGGAFSLFERSVAPGRGNSSHIQHREDECFYVVEGEIESLVGEVELVSSPARWEQEQIETREREQT